MTPRAPLSSLPLLLLLSSATWACGSDTVATSEGGQSGTSSTTAETESGTTDAAESSESTDGNDASSSTSTEGSTSTGEAQCELPQDDTLRGSTATITIENTTAEPRFLSPYSGFFCNYAQAEVLVDGEPVLWDHAGTYPQSCTSCFGGCSDGGTQGLIINPGQTAEISWNGGYWSDTSLSEACGQQACEAEPNWEEGDGVPTTCQTLRAIQDDEYTVRVNVLDTCPLEPDDCTCDDDVCEVFFYEPQPGEYTVEASAAFPAGASVVLE